MKKIESSQFSSEKAIPIMNKFWKAIKNYFYIMLFAFCILIIPKFGFAAAYFCPYNANIAGGHDGYDCSGFQGGAGITVNNPTYWYWSSSASFGSVTIADSAYPDGYLAFVHQSSTNVFNFDTQGSIAYPFVLPYQNNGNTNGIYIDSTNDVTPSNTAGISIIFPINGTSTGAFANWTASTSQTSNLPQGALIGVTYSQTSTLNPPLGNSDTWVFNPNNVIQFIPSTAGQNIATNTTIYAQAWLSDGQENILATSSIISFTLNPTAPFIQNNTAHIIQPASTSTAFCTAPSNSLNIGEGISFGVCSVLGSVFGGQQPSMQFMQSEWVAFQNTPPFNLVFGIASSVIGTVNTTGAQQDLALTLAIGTNNSSVEVLSSSTLTQLFETQGNGHNIPACNLTCAQAKNTTFMGYLSDMIYAGTGITTIAMIL